MPESPDHRLRAARLEAQGLVEREANGLDTPEAVVGHLLAAQAQDGRGARLTIRSRCSMTTTAADVDAALTDRRSLVVSWLNRGTLHLVAPSDYWWLHALTTPQIATSNARRLRQEGVSEAQAAQGVELICAEVSDGPRTRADLGVVLEAAGVPVAGQALVHVLYAATLHGHIVRGPMVGADQAFVATEAWLGPRPDVDREEALANLARRYLVGHGPADERDLAKFAGITLGDARTGFAAIEAETDVWADGLRRLVGDEPSRALPEARLLGSFDPILHGWSSRELFTGSHGNIVTSNGVFRPTYLVDGVIVATWGLDERSLRIKPFAPLTPAALSALDAEAADVRRFLGMKPAAWEVSRM